MTIVCVDDHPIMLKGLSNNIRQILPDASIGAFGNANDAIGFVKENGCDILVSEIELSGVDGLTLSKSFVFDKIIRFFIEIDSLRSGRISVGTWNVAPPIRRDLTSTCGVMFSRAFFQISRAGLSSLAILPLTTSKAE